MLLVGLDVVSSRGNWVSLPLENDGAGILVKKITGLDPVKATLVTSSFASLDGEQYHSSRREARNIVLTVGLDPDYAVNSVENLRDQLYRVMMPKTSVTLQFYMFNKFTDSISEQQIEFDITGIVESFEADLFVAEPEATISIMCPNPDFSWPWAELVSGQTVSNTDWSEFAYYGTVDVGVLFTLRPDRNISQFTIYHKPDEQTQNVIEFAMPLFAGDILEINSVRGSKYVRLTRGGVQRSVLYALSPQSAWIELEPNTNQIRVYAEGASIPWDISYTGKYGGL